MCRCTEPAQALDLPDPFAQADLLLLEMEPRTQDFTTYSRQGLYEANTQSWGWGPATQPGSLMLAVLSYDHRLSFSQITTNQHYRYLTHPEHQKRGWAGFKALKSAMTAV